MGSARLSTHTFLTGIMHLQESMFDQALIVTLQLMDDSIGLQI